MNRVRSAALLFFCLVLGYGSALGEVEGPFTAEIGKSVVEMSGDWRFHLGDDMAWSNPAWNDTGWEKMGGDATWGAQTHPGYTGIAWYRRAIEIKTERGAGSISILMPHVDDAYELYFDGKLIGHSGSLPPHASWYIRAVDAFQLPPPDANGVVRGVIAIRVWKAMLGSTDSNDLGGLNGEPQIGESRVINERLDLNAIKRQRSNMPRTITYFTMLVIGTIALVLWLIDRRRRLNLWLGVFLLAFGGFLPRDFPEYSRHVSYLWDQLYIQLIGCGQDLGTWMIVLTIFGLGSVPRWRRVTGILAAIYASAQIIDCAIFFFWQSNWRPLQGIDAAATLVYSVLPIYLFVLLAAGVRRRPDLALIPMALACTALEMYQIVTGALGQGVRFTHISLPTLIAEAAIHLGPNYTIPLAIQIAAVLLIVLVWTVLREQARDRRRQVGLEAEVKSAKEVQSVLVPEAMEPVAGFAISTLYWPAEEVGGDLFQVLPGKDGDVLVVLADVSGKGLKAAMTVSVLVGAVRTLAEYTTSPVEILQGLNRRLMGRTDGGFATCVVMHVSLDGAVTMGNAGHLAPFVNGEEMAATGSLPLGLAYDAEFEESRFALREGDDVTIYTDGVLEAQSTSGELYGFERAAEIMRPRPTVRAIAEAAKVFGQMDDITVVKIVRVHAEDERERMSVDLRTVVVA